LTATYKEITLYNLFLVLLLSLVVCLGVRSFAEELGTKPLNLVNSDDKKEKSYRLYVGEQEYRLPFKTRISEPFKEGQTIHAVGKVAKDPTRIDFNFHKGSQKDADEPLHLSMNFGFKNYIALWLKIKIY
jgi:hypothetical protein